MTRSGDFVNPILYALICYEIYAIIAGIIGLLFGGLVSLGSAPQASRSRARRPPSGGS
jgi:hypothetical protein